MFNLLIKKMKPIIHKPTYLFLIFCFSIKILQAQDPSQYAPPTPSTASLGKYGEIPVSFYTGLPDISIPIFEIQAKGIALPLKLSYHASGIKVDDAGSWVGLGWSLSAGGCIIQYVQDLADESSSRIEDIPGYGQLNQREMILLHASSSPHQFDLLPDKFTFNFCGYCGSFIYDKDENCYITEDNNLIIRKIDGGFLIIDPNGTKYYFNGIYESTRTGFSTGSLTSITHLLTKIESANKEEVVEFEYEQENYSNYSHQGGVKYFANRSGNAVLFYQSPERILLSTFIGQRLKKIVHGETEILFVRNQNRREDLNASSYPLQEIEIYYNAQKLKSFYLNTSYFPVSKEYIDEVNHPSGTNYSFLNKRLRLNYLTEKDKYGKEIERWTFKYFGDDNPALNLPNRWSCAQDHWGFYNGAVSNEDLIPGHSGNFYDEVFDQFLEDFTCNTREQAITYSFSGANRGPSEFYCKANTLKSITWPAGGRTDFEYSIHSYENYAFPDGSGSGTAGGLRIRSIRNYLANSAFAGGRQYDYSDGLLMENPVHYFRKAVVPFEDLQISPCEDYSETHDVYLEASSNSHFSLAPTGSSVVYKTVEEMEIDSLGQSNGKTSYSYYCPDSFEPDKRITLIYSFYSAYSSSGDNEAFFESGFENSRIWPYFPVYKHEYEWGKLRFKKIYDKNANIKSSVENVYSFEHLKDIPIWRCWPIRLYSDYIHAEYYIPVGTSQLNSVKTTHYFAAGNVTKTEEYIYEKFNKNLLVNNKQGNKYRLLRQKHTTTSDNTSKYTTYHYPVDYSSVVLPQGEQVYDTMVTRNMISPVIEQLEYNNSRFLQSTRTNYFRWDHNMIAPITRDVKYGTDSGYETRIKFERYDDYGNPTQITTEDGVVTSYIWGYHHQYPIAMIVNEIYAHVSAAVSIAQLLELSDRDNDHGLIGSGTNEDTLRSELNDLRDIEGTMVSTYTFDPLIGITSQTDPAGHTTFYEYDPLGRLAYIRDQDGSIIKRYTYHYAGDSSD